MAASAVRQALFSQGRIAFSATPLIICLAELERPGRLRELDKAFPQLLALHLGEELHTDSRLVAEGHAAVGSALDIARQLLYGQGHAAVLIVAADTYVNRATIIANLHARRQLASGIRAGFIPGEAAGVLLVQRHDRDSEIELVIAGQASAVELAARESDQPLRGEGLADAIARAMSSAKLSVADIDLILSDANGEPYRFHELALARTRTNIATPLWLAAESVGDTGSVAGCLQYAWLLQAQARRYLRANTAICVTGNDSGLRSAQIVNFRYRGTPRTAF